MVLTATGPAGWRNVVDNGSDRPTEPGTASAHTTGEVAPWPSCATGDIIVDRAAHHPATTASASRAAIDTTNQARAFTELRIRDPLKSPHHVRTRPTIDRKGR